MLIDDTRTGPTTATRTAPTATPHAQPETAAPLAALQARRPHRLRHPFGQHGARVRKATCSAPANPPARCSRLPKCSCSTPCAPTKVIALWNNFKALGEKLNLAVPAEPLYLLKSPNSYLAHGERIRKPLCDGQGGVRGRAGHRHRQDLHRGARGRRRSTHVFGYTCANDVTVADILNRDASFAQWVRAKGFDTFCPMGPVVATGLDPSTLTVTTRARRRRCARTTRSATCASRWRSWSA